MTYDADFAAARIRIHAEVDFAVARELARIRAEAEHTRRSMGQTWRWALERLQREARA